jgi:type IV pilus biogenesis protein CpaD/CtpE
MAVSCEHPNRNYDAPMRGFIGLAVVATLLLAGCSDRHDDAGPETPSTTTTKPAAIMGTTARDGALTFIVNGLRLRRRSPRVTSASRRRAGTRPSG